MLKGILVSSHKVLVLFCLFDGDKSQFIVQKRGQLCGRSDFLGVVFLELFFVASFVLMSCADSLEKTVTNRVLLCWYRNTMVFVNFGSDTNNGDVTKKLWNQS